VHSPPSSGYRSGSSLAAHRRASTGREVFIAPWPSGEELQVPSCHPYEVRARGSERSRRMRLGTGPGSLEKVAVLGAPVRPQKVSPCRLRSRCLAAASCRRQCARPSCAMCCSLLQSWRWWVHEDDQTVRWRLPMLAHAPLVRVKQKLTTDLPGRQGPCLLTGVWGKNLS